MTTKHYKFWASDISVGDIEALKAVYPHNIPDACFTLQGWGIWSAYYNLDFTVVENNLYICETCSERARKCYR